MHILIYLIFVSAFCLFSISFSFVYMYASFHVRMLSTQSSAKNHFTEQTPCLNITITITIKEVGKASLYNLPMVSIAVSHCQCT